MKTALTALITLGLLAGCGSAKLPESLGGESNAGKALDDRAIAAGILPDSSNRVIAGRYETRSDLGTDKFCAVKKGADQFQIGVLAVFGPESKCEAQGSAKTNGDKIRISFSGKQNCAFDAEFDGIELRFPGAIEQGCSSYCSARASFSGTSYFMVEQGDDNARRALGRDFEKLCD
jgi:hypothetical protein